MDVQVQLSFDLLLLLSLLLTAIILLKFAASKRGLRLPPGPWPLPIIGNIHNLMGSLLPHQALRNLALRYGPIMHLQLGEIHAVIISCPEAAGAIMKTHDINFANRPISTTLSMLRGTDSTRGIIFAPYSEYWRQMRKICVIQLLSLKRVRSFRIIREKEVHDMIQSISAALSKNEPVNIRHQLEVLMNDITVRTMIGSKYKNQDVYLKALEKSAELAAGFNLIDLFPSSRLVRMLSGVPAKAKRCNETVDKILFDLMEELMERKARGEEEIESLFDVLLRIKEEDTLQFPLTLDTIKSFISELFGAGSESSSTLAEWALFELVKNPKLMKKAQSEIRELLSVCKSVTESDLASLNYLHLVIKETLRLHPPAPLLLPRKCSETCRILGYDIPEGTLVLVNIWAIGRDPKYWQDPEEFRPERFINSNVDFRGTDFEFLPFGSGRRMCPGMSFGLATVEIALANLLYHFDWKLPYGVKPEDIDMSESLGVTARRKIPLCLDASRHEFELDMGMNY